jgi:RNA polymerase sigma-B factor
MPDHEHRGGDWQRHRSDQRLRRRGDSRARAELAERYLPLARSLAWRYRHRGEPLEDLVQVASLGLVKAIERWDPDRGLEFSSFAVPTIVGTLRRHFRDHSWPVRPPRRTQELFVLAAGARDELWRELARAPSVAEIAALLGRSYEDVLDAVEAVSAQKPRSLDAPLAFGDFGETRADRVAAPDSGYAGVEDRLFLDVLTASLSRRAREVVRLRFHDELIQREIADCLGCSQMQVSRILRDALNELRRVAERQALIEPPPRAPAAP